MHMKILCLPWKSKAPDASKYWHSCRYLTKGTPTEVSSQLFASEREHAAEAHFQWSSKRGCNRNECISLFFTYCLSVAWVLGILREELQNCFNRGIPTTKSWALLPSPLCSTATKSGSRHRFSQPSCHAKEQHNLFIPLASLQWMRLSRHGNITFKAHVSKSLWVPPACSLERKSHRALLTSWNELGKGLLVKSIKVFEQKHFGMLNACGQLLLALRKAFFTPTTWQIKGGCVFWRSVKHSYVLNRADSIYAFLVCSNARACTRMTTTSPGLGSTFTTLKYSTITVMQNIKAANIRVLARRAKTLSRPETHKLRHLLTRPKTNVIRRV